MQIVISFNKPKNVLELDKECWQIEAAFRAMKTSGFNIENTHMTGLDRIEKLSALVMVAFS